MSDTTVKNEIKAAFTPYAMAFCSKPAQAELVVSVDGTSAAAVLLMGQSDFDELDASATLRSTITRAYSGLVRRVGGARTPIMLYDVK